MQNIVSYKAPKLKPLPTDITDDKVREATLPVKIEAARRAIANCTDLPELLRYQDQAQGLAAAVKVMKHVAPEMVAKANRMCKESLVKMGELLLQYKGEGRPVNSKGHKGKIGHQTGDRYRIAKELGIRNDYVTYSTRLAAAPKDILEKVLADNSIPVNPRVLGSMVPRRGKQRKIPPYSDAMRMVMNGNYRAGCSGGLNGAFGWLSRIPLEAFKQLKDDEKIKAKHKITETIELLDEMDRLCR